jgi:poly(A) polymerase
MTAAATAVSIGGAAFLADPRLARLFAAIETADDRCWVVGGAVRNALLGLPVVEVDVATTALPDEVAARATAAGLKAVPTGIAHGTVTVVIDGRSFEVTTLRRDVATDGRRAVVAFGRDRPADALRRDFTMNALYAGLDGRVDDPVGGLDDCRAGRVRFIGEPARRIAEDRLRMLRFFRFHAAYGRGAIDAAGLAAVIAARDGLAELSAERIGQETLKLVVASGAPATVALMSDVGILQRILGRLADLAGFARLHRWSATTGHPVRGTADAVLFLAALAGWSEADGLALASRLRLSNAARDRMVRAIAGCRRVPREPGDTGLLHLLDHAGEAAVDAVALAVARGRLDADAATAAVDRLAGLEPPVLPIGGGDLRAIGCPQGAEIGRILGEIADRWRAADFRPGRDDLLAAARGLIARIGPNPPSGT